MAFMSRPVCSASSVNQSRKFLYARRVVPASRGQRAPRRAVIGRDAQSSEWCRSARGSQRPSGTRAPTGGADDTIQYWPWGSYSGLFDPEVMQRVIIETIESAGVDVLLHSQVTAAVMQGSVAKALSSIRRAAQALRRPGACSTHRAMVISRPWPAQSSCLVQLGSRSSR